MEFDKSRVYTALNADELPIGCRCVFARSVFILKDHLHCDYPSEILISVGSDTSMERFESDSGEWYSLAYLVEPPAEPKYKPFESVEKAMEAIKAHGRYVIKTNNMMSAFLVTEDDEDQEESRIFIDSHWYSLQELCRLFVFADDGSPCGELDEE